VPFVALDPVDVRIAQKDGSIHFERENCHISFHCESRAQLQHILEAYHYLLPIVLNVDFLDAPVVETVVGIANGIEFCWGVLTGAPGAFDATTTPLQEEKLIAAVRRLRLLDGEACGERRRLVAALHWFHVACRLERAGHSSWEFLAEILLNYAKILEVLFPATGGETIRAARHGLALLGFSSAEIEARYVPALALRNSIDVAHVSLAVFDRADLEVIHQYCAEAEFTFRELLGRVCNKLAAGEWELPEYSDAKPSSGTRNTIKRIRAARLQVAAANAPEGESAG
jgi:hypothetical protein